eukprot:g37690.t1
MVYCIRCSQCGLLYISRPSGGPEAAFCTEDRIGKFCECDPGQRSTQDLDAACRKDNSSATCSNQGDCVMVNVIVVNVSVTKALEELRASVQMLMSNARRPETVLLAVEEEIAHVTSVNVLPVISPYSAKNALAVHLHAPPMSFPMACSICTTLGHSKHLFIPIGIIAHN